MASSSRRFEQIIENLESNEVIEIDYIQFGIEMPKMLLEFIESNPRLEEEELRILLINLGYLMFKAIKDNNKHPMVWNLGDKQ